MISGPDKYERDQLLFTFGQNLRAHRVLADLTQQTLAERSFLGFGQKAAQSVRCMHSLGDVCWHGKGWQPRSWRDAWSDGQAVRGAVRGRAAHCGAVSDRDA
jgi:hypothetical protein